MMTVADLIRELQAMPNQHAPAWVQAPEVYDETTGLYLSQRRHEVDEVRHEGPYVVVRGGGDPR